MRPIVNGLEQQYKGRIQVSRMNFHDRRVRAVVREYGADFRPAFVFLRADGGLNAVILGEADPERLQAEIERIVGQRP